MIRSHIVITGTGRAGTTFLVQLLTHLGLDTGFDVDTIDLSPIARASLETDIRDPNAPYIVKSPFLCDLAEEVVASSVRIGARHYPCPSIRRRSGEPRTRSKAYYGECRWEG